MKREVIEEEPWLYSLVSEGGSSFLEICCGRAGVYEVTIELTEAENARPTVEPYFIRVFAQQISDNPENFRDRFVKD